MTFQQFKIQSIKELSGSPSPSLDVEVLMQWILKKDRSYILFHRDEELSEEQESQLKKSSTDGFIPLMDFILYKRKSSSKYKLDKREA